MKQLLSIVVITLILPLGVYSQKLSEYKASNNVTYKIGDKIIMNQGSGNNGKFVYLTIGGLGASLNAEQNQIGAAHAGLPVKIKKIKRHKFKGVHKVMFTVGGGNIVNYLLDIESAIASCEVNPCKSKEGYSSTDKYDKLKKLKELLDSGVLTQEEFDKEKEKILKEQ